MMTPAMLFFILGALLAVIPSRAAPSYELSGASNSSSLDTQPIRELLTARQVPGCNLHVCIALDGSGSMTKATFNAQKNFALDFNSIFKLDNKRAKLSVVQFGYGAAVEQPLSEVVEKTASVISRLRPSSGRTNLAGGIVNCWAQLTRQPEFARHIIVMSDSDGNFGGMGSELAKMFRGTGGLLSVVGAGYRNMKSLQKLAGPKQEVYDVTNIQDSFKLADISEKLYKRVCKIQ